MLPGYLKLRLRLEIAGFRPGVLSVRLACRSRSAGARVRPHAVERTGERKVFVVAHSMGGLVARAALALRQERRIAKLCSLVRRTTVRMHRSRRCAPSIRRCARSPRSIARTPPSTRAARFHTLPGLYQMLPSQLRPSEPDLFDRAQLARRRSGPDAKLLDRARRIRARLPAADESCHAVVGVEQDTIVARAAMH